MDDHDGGHHEDGRSNADQSQTTQGQWLMHPQLSMKQIMVIMGERDAAVHERNIAISEKKAAIAERDLAFLQRDSAFAERNNAIMERDNAIATLRYRETSFPSGNLCQISRGLKQLHQLPHHAHQMANAGEASGLNNKETNANSDIAVPLVAAMGAAPKPEHSKRSKLGKKASKPHGGKAKKGSENMNKLVFGIDGNDMNKQIVELKPDWKENDFGLNRVAFDDTTMPAPVCSCTGVFRQCYKWGNGGWQSSCCTTAISMFPLPTLPNKRHARVGGRKMSGGAFSKLLSRLAGEGHDLSSPVDLKHHWAKHGTNRYITIR